MAGVLEKTMTMVLEEAVA
jgi:hypothetical protein